MKFYSGSNMSIEVLLHTLGKWSSLDGGAEEAIPELVAIIMILCHRVLDLEHRLAQQEVSSE